MIPATFGDLGVSASEIEGAIVTLPNFLVIGAAKAGTTSFIHYLEQHPDVFVNTQKAKIADFFCGNGSSSDRTLADYEPLFDAGAGCKAIGEVTGRYMSTPGAAQLLAEHLPRVRLIATLRNPIERAYSGYLMQVRKGRERRPVEDCFRRGDGYVDGGFYHERLQPYLDRFPSDQLQLCLFDDLKADSTSMMRDVYAFLEIDSTFVPDTGEVHNPGGYPQRRWLARVFTAGLLQEHVFRRAPGAVKRLGRKLRARNLVKKPMPPELRERLADLYRNDVEQLQRVMRRDLSHWLA